MAENCQIIYTHLSIIPILLPHTSFNMATAMWKNYTKLKNDLIKYVQQRLWRTEILDFMTRDYPCYKWSLRSLDRKLDYFEIRDIDGNVSVEDAREAMIQELDGPLLGYRAMTNKLRQKYNLKVPRDLVHNFMFDLDPDGVAARAPGVKSQKVIL